MNPIRLLAAMGMAAFSLGAFAQQAPVPSNMSAPVTPARLEYRSAFDGYRFYRELEARSWRESNEEAGSLRGHAGHIKPPASSAASEESTQETAGAPTTAPATAQPTAPSSSPAASTTAPRRAPPPATKPAAGGHGGHGK